MRRPDFFSKRTKEIRTSSFRRRAAFSFVSFALLLLAAIFFWKWLNHQPTEQGALKPLRKTLEANEKVFKTAVFDTNHLAKKYSAKGVMFRDFEKGASFDWHTAPQPQ